MGEYLKGMKKELVLESEPVTRSGVESIPEPGHSDSSLRAKAAICRRVLSASFSRILCIWLFAV